MTLVQISLKVHDLSGDPGQGVKGGVGVSGCAKSQWFRSIAISFPVQAS